MSEEQKEPVKPEAPEGNAGAPSAATRRPFNWDAVAAVIAALVGLLAILVSAYEVRSIRQQTRAEIWPHITVGATGILPTYVVENGVSREDGGGLIAVNHGVGPAVVRRVEVLVNGKPVPDWSRLSKALGYPRGQPGATSMLNDTVISPGQEIYLIVVAGRKTWLRFERKVFREVVIRTCYCSTLGECWINTWKHAEPFKHTRPVGSCAKIPEEDEFNG